MSPAPSPLASGQNRVLRTATKRLSRQKPLFCACGERIPAIAGLCSKCYRMRRHSRVYFAGNRETVLIRDAFRCRSCGAGDASVLHVHHRCPGNSDPDLLVTVCSACHARLHRLASIHTWIPELLAVLWAEQHPLTPVQLQLSFGAEA